MTAHNRLWRPALLLFVVVASGCVSSRSSPRGVIPTDRGVAVDVRGAWVQIETRDGGVVQGELLAVEARGEVHLLTLTSQYQRIAVTSVASARLEAYRNNWSGPAAWGGVGTVSTITHGFILGLSAPIWGAASATASVAQSKTGFYRIPTQMTWDRASMYARFPAGMPAGVDPNRLLFLQTPPSVERQ
ncbi:MAG: hypothetical protein AAFQ43_10090 [Bacteroidota bacterium]